MEIVFAPWRMKYILGDKPDGCFLCDAIAQGVSVETLVLRKTTRSVVLLNRYPYISGHLMVVPIDHVSPLELLDNNALDDLHRTLADSVALLKKAMNPCGLNVGMNLGKAAGAGLEDHLHYHVVPRFYGDVNAMDVVSGTRVIPEALEVTYQKLKQWGSP